MDFRNDAAANQKIYSVDSIEIIEGTAGGLTFGDEEDWGKEGTQAKFSITPVEAGTYTVRVTATYSQPSGPKPAGDITVIVE